MNTKTGLSAWLRCLMIGIVAVSLAPAGLEAQSESAPRPQIGDRYTFGVGDVLTVSVWKDAELSAQVQVQPDGMISLPLIGELSIVGRTSTEIQTVLEEKYGEFVTAPGVSVIINQINSRKIYILGEVSASGVYDLLQPTTVLQALAMAGGFNEYADKSNVVLIRFEDGNQKRFELNLKAIITGKSTTENLMLQPGDTVVVP